MLALHVLKERERLAQGPERVLDTGLAVDLRRRVLRFEQRTDRPGDVLRHAEDLLRDIRVLLERLERMSECFPSLPRFVRR